MPEQELTPIASAKTLPELLQTLREIGELIGPDSRFVTLVVERPGMPDTVIPVKVTSDSRLVAPLSSV